MKKREIPTAKAGRFYGALHKPKRKTFQNPDFGLLDLSSKDQILQRKNVLIEEKGTEMDKLLTMCTKELTWLDISQRSSLGLSH